MCIDVLSNKHMHGSTSSLQQLECPHTLALFSRIDRLNNPFRSGLVPKIFYPKLSHRILRHMHGVLNIDEKKLIAQFGWKSRDKCFKTN
jgi:hypothetical protein